MTARMKFTGTSGMNMKDQEILGPLVLRYVGEGGGPVHYNWVYSRLHYSCHTVRG